MHIRNANEKRELGKIEEMKRKKNLWITPFLFVPLAFGLFPIVLVVVGLISEIIKIEISFFPCIVLAIILALLLDAYSFIWAYKSEKHLDYYKEAEEEELNAAIVNKEAEEFVEASEHYIAIIAPEYRYPVASYELLRIFQLGRAETLPEAYDKLELKLHQMRLEEKLNTIIALQIELLAVLSRIEYNTKWII